MLASPHAGINDEFERPSVEPQECGETTQVDGPEKLEEFHSVLWIFREVLVDHVKRALEDAIHDVDNLVFHHAL